MKNKRVVITGGAGFIGSNLAHRLAVENFVVILDDLSTGRKENITALVEKDNVIFIKGSILDLSLLKQVFNGIDFVFHQAALPSVPRSVEDPLTTNEVNITGTLNVLTVARDNNVKKVVFASSSSVYGDTPTLPKSEDMTTNPQSPYALTKLAGELYCHIFHQIYRIPTICLRYFNVYGPRQDLKTQYAAVIPRIISRIQQGKPPIIYGDGEQTRDLTYIKDAVAANVLAAESTATGTFNVGGGKSITINRLAELIMNLMGSHQEPVHEQPRPGDVKHSLAAIDRARVFGYQPNYTVEAGLNETIRWFNDEKA